MLSDKELEKLSKKHSISKEVIKNIELLVFKCILDTGFESKRNINIRHLGKFTLRKNYVSSKED